MTDAKKDFEPERRVFKDDHYNLVNPKGATHLDGIPEEVFQFIERKGFSLSTHIAGKLPPQHPFIIHIVLIAFFFLWIVSFFGNNCVFCVILKVHLSNCFLCSNLFSKRRSLRRPSNMTAVKLPFPDLVMMTTMDLSIVVNGFTLPRSCHWNLHYSQHGWHWP